MAHQLYLCFIFVASSDLVIPAHTTVIIGTFKLHRRPDIYPNPDQFNPDNFLPEKSASRHYYSFIPFSAGPRSCVGKYSKPNISIFTLDCVIYKGIKHFGWCDSTTQSYFLHKFALEVFQSNLILTFNKSNGESQSFGSTVCRAYFYKSQIK